MARARHAGDHPGSKILSYESRHRRLRRLSGPGLAVFRVIGIMALVGAALLSFQARDDASSALPATGSTGAPLSGENALSSEVPAGLHELRSDASESGSRGADRGDAGADEDHGRDGGASDERDAPLGPPGESSGGEGGEQGRQDQGDDDASDDSDQRDDGDDDSDKDSSDSANKQKADKKKAEKQKAEKKKAEKQKAEKKAEKSKKKTRAEKKREKIKETMPGSLDPIEGCDATVPKEGKVSNGKLGSDHMCDVGGPHKLRADAAASFQKMSERYERKTGKPMSKCIGDSYRPYEQQVSLSKQKPRLAAKPGTSNHGWGQAIDFLCQANDYNSGFHKWMKRNAGDFGWENPDWAKENGQKPEPWHWEFNPDLL